MIEPPSGRGGCARLMRLALLACTVAAPARADDTNTNLARVTSPESGYFGVEHADTIARGALHAGAMLDAGRRLLVIRDPATDAIVRDGEVVAARLSLHLTAGLGVTERLELAAAVSLAVQRGDEAIDRPAVRQAALGDLRLQGKLRLWQRGGVTLAGIVAVSLPTSSRDAMFGDRSLALRPAIVAGVRAGRAELATEVGYRIRDASRFADLTVDDEISVGFAARYRLAARVWAQGELDAALGVQGRGNAQERPAEALAGVRIRVDDRWLAQAGLGVGLGPGYGAPALRGVVMIGYAPVAPPARAERVAWMPSETPDEGASIAPPPPAAERVPRFRVVGDRIVLPAAVLFALDGAEVQAAGREVLGDVVQAWLEHSEWAEMTIEGHADVRGQPGANQRLSEERARQVQAVLVALGITPERLHAVGFGASRPVTTGTTEEDHARNRRVELVITRRRVEDGGAP